jgi:hypothetical protein
MSSDANQRQLIQNRTDGYGRASTNGLVNMISLAGTIEATKTNPIKDGVEFSVILAYPCCMLPTIGLQVCPWLERSQDCDEGGPAGKKREQTVESLPPKVQRVLRDVCRGDANGKKVLKGMIPHIFQASIHDDRKSGDVTREISK